MLQYSEDEPEAYRQNPLSYVNQMNSSISPVASRIRSPSSRMLLRRLRAAASTITPHAGGALRPHAVRPLVSVAHGRRRFSSPAEPPREGLLHWRAFGYPYMLRRGGGIVSRVYGRWSQFIDYYERGLFARSSGNEACTRMYVLTCMPRVTTVDLFEFLSGATHAVRRVYDELYAAETGITYPNVETDRLKQLVANDAVLATLTRKPQRQAQRLAVHAEPRKTKLALEGLEIRHVGLASVDYRMEQIPEGRAKQLGYHEDEWLRMEVAYELVEHIRVSAAHNVSAAIDDFQTFETTFTWTFESNVSDPSQLDWTIVDASDFQETPAIMKRTPRRPLG
jgi:hypothetical protein